jgi:hypothetical protein
MGHLYPRNWPTADELNLEIEVYKPEEWERDDLEDVDRDLVLEKLVALSTYAPATVTLVRSESSKLLIAVDGAKFFAGLDEDFQVYELRETDVTSPDAEVEISVGGQVTGMPREKVLDIDSVTRVVAWFFGDEAEDMRGLSWV